MILTPPPSVSQSVSLSVSQTVSVSVSQSVSVSVSQSVLIVSACATPPKLAAWNFVKLCRYSRHNVGYAYNQGI